MKKLTAVLLALVLVLLMVPTVSATEIPEFTYELQLTDKDGIPVTDPRFLSDGDTLHVEIVLIRTDIADDYDMYGIEFRLLTQGLQYNNDGKTLRSGTKIREENYSDGKYVGFAWYDLYQVGEHTNNPVLVAKWSYTVTDSSIVNIKVPVTIVYATGCTESCIPLGTAYLRMDPNGGEIVGADPSGEYTSGTAVKLPEAKRGGYKFLGWSDGIDLYPAGSEYVLSGYVTLVAQWEELPRNLHLTLDPNGGQIIGEDVSGDYAAGEVVVLPDAEREGFVFLGWNDGVATYGANEEYTVTAAATLVAQWEPVPTDPVDPTNPTDPTDPTIPTQPTDPTNPTNPIDPTDPTEPTTPADPTDPEKPTPNSSVYLAAGAGTGILGLLLLLLLLWKRSLVQYSLVTGDVSLYFKNGEIPAEVSVVLYDGEKEYHLNKSGRVEVKHRLRFIKNTTNIAVADIETGTYQGKLLIHEGNDVRVKKCRIKVLDRELDNKSGN